MRQKTLSLLNYSIHWLSQSQELADAFAEAQEQNPSALHFVITSDYIYSLYKNFIDAVFNGAQILQIPDGEAAKSISTVENLCNMLAEKNADRKSVIWALGGGVVGDIAGFTAAVFMRGISFIQVPTTFLAMVDSSVGGKTGVNLAIAKNSIGCFYQPRRVFIYTSFLQTLARREMLCGLAETLKAALLMDKELFFFMEENISALGNKDLAVLEALSLAAVKIKAQVVEQDEKENNLRAILNLGHTLAHALESAVGYKSIHHGEAVSVGLHFSLRVSVKENFLSQATAQRVINFMRCANLPLFVHEIPAFANDINITADNLIALMKKDKKNQQGKIYFVLLKDIGSYILPQPLEQDKIYSYVQGFLT